MDLPVNQVLTDGLWPCRKDLHCIHLQKICPDSISPVPAHIFTRHITDDHILIRECEIYRLRLAVGLAF
ncbi:MAG: hypothetical protein ABI416_09555, partial [Ginsengibacter sp.]